MSFFTLESMEKVLRLQLRASSSYLSAYLSVQMRRVARIPVYLVRLSFVLSMLASEALAETNASTHETAQPNISVLLLGLSVIYIAAKIGCDLMVRLKLPEVLGELLAGIVLGNLSLIGFHSLEFLKHDLTLHNLSELGVILLLFDVGLHSSLPEMLKVGVASTLVAVVGVVTPLILGFLVAAYFLPGESVLAHIFVGATLTATSVGITARVLKDLGQVNRPESQIILGAAVIDDVLGLLVLAVVGGVIHSANEGSKLEMLQLVKIIGLSLGFFLGALSIGRHFSARIFRAANILRSQGVLLSTSLVFCFSFAILASAVGLAPIVGAFTAGLLLETADYEELSARHKNMSIGEFILPVSEMLVPIFFVVMGARVDLAQLFSGETLLFSIILTFVAILGKQVCGFVVRERQLDRVLIGIGMIPRGEVGLIFAGYGATLILNGEPVVNGATYGAVVMMVIITSLVTPILLARRFRKHQ